MGIVNCTNCKKKISDKAPDCPHCGYGEKTASNPSVKRGLGRQGYIILCILNLAIFLWPSAVSGYALQLLPWLIIGLVIQAVLSAFRFQNIGENMAWGLLGLIPIMNLFVFVHLCLKPTRYTFKDV
jgi:hypothetical protein